MISGAREPALLMKDFPMELLVDVEDGVQFPLRISVTLAQLVERLTFNQVVMGSSPICDKSPHLRQSASGECVGVTRSNYSPVAT